MYIAGILNYNNGLELINKDFSTQYSEILEAIGNVNINEHLSKMRTGEYTYGYMLDGSFMQSLLDNLSVHHWYSNPDVFKGEYYKGTFRVCTFLGILQQPVNSAIYYEIPRRIKNGISKVEVLVFFTKKTISENDLVASHSFEKEVESFLSDNMETTASFIVLGISNEEVDHVEVIDMPTGRTSNSIVDRSIEFPPQYLQAGIGILSYFNKVLLEKYPSVPASVKIIQTDLIVRMVVETDTGHKEIVEKALTEYGQLMNGSLRPEDYLQNSLQVLELKNELRIASVRIEMQNDIIFVQKGQIDKFLEIIGQGISKGQAPIQLNVSPIINIQNNNHQNTSIQNEYGELVSYIRQLHTISPDSIDSGEVLKEIAELNTTELSVDVIKNSSVLEKIKSFINKANAVNETGNKVFGTIEGGISLLKKATEQYNKLAGMLGIDTLPF